MGAYPSEWAAIVSIAEKLGIAAPETLRTWVRRAEVDGGHRPGVTAAERERLQQLERENQELRRANEILKAAAAFFARRGPATVASEPTGWTGTPTARTSGAPPSR